MRRLVVALILLIAVAGGVVLMAGPGAQASPDATITVNSTADTNSRDNELALREAMMLANGGLAVGDLLEEECAQVSNSTYGPPCSTTDTIGAGSTDTIEFDIPGAGPHTIQPTSGLPTVTDPVIIDGTSEPDFGGSPIVELDGSGAGSGVDGLTVTAGSSTVKGLVINRFGGHGIELATNGANTIEGNYIGTDVGGTADLGNGLWGIAVSGSGGNAIGGTTGEARNVISGNYGGLEIFGTGATANQVQGNYIGTDKNGTADLGNSERGVYITVSNNTVGGTAQGAGNVISGNDEDGVFIIGGSGNRVEGNYIGTDKNGTADLGNSLSGINIHNGASDNTIGGTVAGAGNVISGNDHSGVYIPDGGTRANKVQGNYIGTDVTGTADLGNSQYGVYIYAAQNNTIGGTTEAARNVISGNGRSGVYIQGFAYAPATGNQVQGNYIGTDRNGTGALGNSHHGVLIEGAASSIVGGATGDAGNIIAFNALNGVTVAGTSATGNAIRGNSVHSNGSKGIETSDGGNSELAPPIVDGAGFSVSGHTNPKCYPCTVEVFSDDEDEGRIFHGSASTNDDATGTWTYAGAVTGPNITATITDAGGNTSEFSVPVALSPPVGGMANLPDASGSSGLNYAAVPLAGLAAAVLVALSAGAWYTRRRWLG